MSRTSFLFAAAIAVGCGGIAIIDGVDETTTTTTSTTSTSSSSSGGGNISGLALESAFAFSSCSTGNAAPLDVEFTVDLVNTGTESIALQVTGASLEGAIGTTDFQVAPAMVTLIPGSNLLNFVKTGPASGVDGCDWCTQMDIELVVRMVFDGEPRELRDDLDSISCN